MAGSDLERGLRFIHLMEVETRTELSQNSVDVTALADLLIAKGIITSRELDERKKLTIPQQNERDQKRRLPMVGPGVDKYTLTSPDIPCVENLPLCRAACCSLVFNLGIQDLDEGVVRWEYGLPYRIRLRQAAGDLPHLRLPPGQAHLGGLREARTGPRPRQPGAAAARAHLTSW
jgi:hypothetical protein